jgi:hypothetical protein
MAFPTFKYILRKSTGLLHKAFSKLNPQATTEECLEILRLAAAEKYYGPVIRIGDAGDGSYIVPEDLSGIVASVSPGVNREYEFDLELGRMGIKSYMFDASIDKPTDLTSMQEFHKLFLDTYDSRNTISLPKIVQNIGVEQGQNLLLQMDIEGSEYRCINSTDVATLNRFAVIILELHDFNIFAKNKLFNRYWLRPFLIKLRQNHNVIHVHPNNQRETTTIHGIDFPNVLEITLVHKLRWPSRNGEPFNTRLLDFVTNKNLPYTPLSDSWFS